MEPLPALAALLGLALPLLAADNASAPQKQKPNVLFLVFDDLNNRLGCYGNPVAKSRNFDRLATRGTVVIRAFCQQPIRGPSRASFMSGRRPDSLGLSSMIKYLYDLHPDAVTIPQWFMQHGYTALSIGKHDTWGKMTLFGWDARGPLIISAPGAGQRGGKTAALGELIDLFPTLTELCGLPDPPQLDGTSLVPVLKDAASTVKTAALTQFPRPALYWGGGPQALPEVMGYAIKTDRWSYHEWRDFRTGRIVAQELYDEQNDPLEREPAGKPGHAAVLKQHQAFFDQLLPHPPKRHDRNA